MEDSKTDRYRAVILDMDGTLLDSNDAHVKAWVEALREHVKAMRITYVWVVDGEGRLSGIVTMRDLLFAAKHLTLREVMTKDPFVLQAAMPLREAMKQVLDRHYPVYPVLDAAGRLTGLRGGAHVNLIPLNATGGFPGTPSDRARIEEFAQRLRAAGVEASIRRNRGTTIDAACGQLRARHDLRSAPPSSSVRMDP